MATLLPSEAQIREANLGAAPFGYSGEIGADGDWLAFSPKPTRSGGLGDGDLRFIVSKAAGSAATMKVQISLVGGVWEDYDPVPAIPADLFGKTVRLEGPWAGLRFEHEGGAGSIGIQVCSAWRLDVTGSD